MSLRAYAQLVRLPNLPTTLADITLGALATSVVADWRPWVMFSKTDLAWWGSLLCLLLASACLYMSGMVWNDYFDVEEDTKDRPERPIPSGRISRQTAGRLGAGLMILGVGFACLAGVILVQAGRATSVFWPVTLALSIVVAVLFYDAWLKHTAMGPVAMGTCRFLNVLLGVSISGGPAWPMGPHLALVVGLYIVGVTWFARTEAHTSKKSILLASSAVILASFLLALPLPVYRPTDTASLLFPYLLVGLGFALSIPLLKAVNSPTPSHVQAGVKRALMSLILLDTVLATATAGTWGLLVLVYMVPSIYLNRQRWLYAT